jgi:tRNA/rRNA methyltransferase
MNPASKPLDNLAVVLCRPKYSENIGATARACLNMGCSRLILVRPRELDMDRALALGTLRSRIMLENARVVSDLSEALADRHAAFAATARPRSGTAAPLDPEAAAEAASGYLQRLRRVAAVFGPEDSGLTNAEVRRCTHVLSIPAAADAPSLNLAQAVLLVLFEMRKHCVPRDRSSAELEEHEPATLEDRRLLFQRIQQALLDIGFLDSGNPEHFMGRVRRTLNRMEPARDDLRLLLGICRRISNLKSRLNGKDPDPR